MTRVAWYLKQILPMKYSSTFLEGGQRKHCEWRMWLGRCFDINTTTIEEEADT